MGREMKNAALKKIKDKIQPPPPPPPPEVKVTEATEAMQEVLKQRLSKERYEHSTRVAKECKRLAEIYHVNADIAEFTGMVHDICKEMKSEEQEPLLKASEGFEITDEEWASKKLWHGIAGAQMLKQQYRVGNQTILNAVRYHTVARKGMTTLEKIVYLSDMTEEGRSFIDVHVLRNAVNRDLDLGMYYALRISIEKVMQKGGLLPKHTIEAYNQYVAIVAAMKS
ncbi:MAG: bis(5'-nucleosyl)-tetraphosphatase (symmetrical) YqeK [Oscillospiraceae bacterium]|nr:bis(5'-nucleosyl)-tetraphosphatase (symmetrical) YqeK [Oscillospiraceae bacterium]